MSFARVTIIERDQLPAGPEFRKGVPQGKHTHVLSKKGADILTRLFPGLFTDLIREGTTVVDSGRDLHWFQAGYWKLQDKNGIELHSQSRPFLEWHIRKI